MSDQPTQPQRTGFVLMAIASLSVSVVDGIAKHLVAEHSPAFIAWARYAVASIFVIPYAFLHLGCRIFPNHRLGLHALRTLCLVLAMTSFFVALRTAALSEAVVAFFSGPVIASGLAIVVLKERPTLCGSLGVVVGFWGVFVAMQPAETPSAGTMYAFVAGVFLAFYLVATRLAGHDNHPLKTLAFQCAFGAALLLPVAAMDFHLPAVGNIGLFFLMGGVSAVVHLMVIRAFQLAPASMLAPLVYLELVGAALVGIWFFDEIPERHTLLGGLLIMCSGLLVWIAADRIAESKGDEG